MVVASHGADMRFDFSGFNAYPASNRWMTLQALTPLRGNVINYTSDTSGIKIISNLSSGYFSVVIKAKGNASEIPFQVYVTATDSGLLEASNRTSVAGVQTYPSTGAAAWTIQASDQKYQSIPTNNSTASDGQVISKTGDKAKWIDMSGGGGGGTTYTNNSDGLPGVVVGAGIGTNYASITAPLAGTNETRAVTHTNAANQFRGKLLWTDGTTLLDTADGFLKTTGGILVADIQGTSLNDPDTGADSVLWGNRTLSKDDGATTSLDWQLLHLNGAWRLDTAETNTALTGGVLAADANGKRKIATLSGLSWDGSSLTVNSGGPLVGDGSGLSNVVNASIPMFNSISNMIAASVTNNEVIVNSYWGTNHSPGRFRLFTGTMTTNLGTIFTNGVSGGYRVRVEWLQRTNELKLEWFGTWPNQYDVTSGLRDQSDRVQAAIDATPGDQGVLIIPEYWITITNSLVFTNWRGAYFGGATAATRRPGYRYWPYPVSGFNWNGPTNLAMIKQHNVGHTTFAHFGLDTRPPAQAAYWSNYATLMIDADQLTGHITTTSANRYSGMMFRERGTNAGLVGVRIANTSWDNCEFFHFEDCYFAGSGASDRSQYWMATTNIGAATAIQVGGNGGGANSFSHTLTRCGFDSWQYFVNGNGNWYVQNCYGTAAGVRGYHFTGNAASYLIGVNDEGDRQFAYSTGPLYLESCRIALVSLSVSNIAAVDGPQITMNNCVYNNDPSGNTPSVTNSYNATGRYSGRNNTLASVNNDALSISSWRFSSAFNSLGDFGTIAANNNIQSFPMKTPSALSLTNKVWADYLDSATWPYLTLMPSNGSLAVGSPGGNAVLSVFNTDPAVKYHYSFGDAVKTIRHRGYAGGATTYAEVNGLSQGWQIIQSTNAVFNLKAGNANSTINFQSGYGSITTTGDVAVVRFENDGRVRFPNNTNVEFVGPIHGGVLRATNHLTLFTNDTLASLGATPTRYGQISLVDSNATLLAATATTSGTLAWAGTNSIPTTASQVVGKFSGTPTGSLFLRDDGTLAAPSVGGVAWGAISGTLSSQTDLQTALDGKATIASPNQFTKTNAFDALRATNMAQGVSSALVGWVADTKLFTTGSVVVAGSQISLSGTDGALLYNNAGGVDFADWSVFNSQGGTLTTNNATLSGLTKGNGARGVINADWSDVQALTSNPILTNNHSAAVVFGNTITSTQSTSGKFVSSGTGSGTIELKDATPTYGARITAAAVMTTNFNYILHSNATGGVLRAVPRSDSPTNLNLVPIADPATSRFGLPQFLGTDGTSFHWTNASAFGFKRTFAIIPTRDANFTSIGLTSPNSTGTPAAIAAGSYHAGVRVYSAGTTGSQAGYLTGAYVFGYGQPYDVSFVVASTNWSSARSYLGLTSTTLGNLVNDQAPTTRHFIGFRASTNSVNWQFVTCGGSGLTATDTGIAFANNTITRLRFICDGSTTAIGYINGVSVATNLANLPAQGIGPVWGIQTLEAVVKAVDIYSFYGEASF